MTDFKNFDELLNSVKNTKPVKDTLYSASEEDKLEELRELEKDLESLRKRVFKMRRELGR